MAYLCSSLMINEMETPKILVEFFKLFTKPREVVIVSQLPNRKLIRFLTRHILLLEQEKKWYLEHDDNDFEYLVYLDSQINKLTNRRNTIYNVHLHEIIKYKTDPDVKLKIS
jgi:hypothetical protein